LVRHDMAPVAGRVTDRQKDRFILSSRFLERFLSPWIPVDWIVRVLEKIRRFLTRKPILVLYRRFHYRNVNTKGVKGTNLLVHNSIASRDSRWRRLTQF